MTSELFELAFLIHSYFSFISPHTAKFIIYCNVDYSGRIISPNFPFQNGMGKEDTENGIAIIPHVNPSCPIGTTPNFYLNRIKIHANVLANFKGNIVILRPLRPLYSCNKKENL